MTKNLEVLFPKGHYLRIPLLHDGSHLHTRYFDEVFKRNGFGGNLPGTEVEILTGEPRMITLILMTAGSWKYP